MYRSGLRLSTRMAVPVVVVGNVVAGGAGKTPLVMALVEHLRAQGWHPGVVSRGYGRRTRHCLEVMPDASAADCGDEPLLIRQRCGVPVVVAAERVQAAQALLQAHPLVDILVADDGLQHLALASDVRIAVFDDRGLGNGWLLPAGPLREGWRGQVDLVLHSGEQPAFAGFRASRCLAAHGLSAQGERVDLARLQSGKVVAVAGIAKPQSFFDMLRRLGLPLKRTLALPDHHAFERLELLDDPEATVLCTQKDAVKLFPLHPHAGTRLLAVPLEVSPEPAFFEALDQLLAQGRSRQPHPLPSAHGHTTS